MTDFKNSLKSALPICCLTGIILAQNAVPAHATGNLLTPLDKTFIKKAAQGGLAEVMTSRLALTHSRNKNVLMVARRMVKEHSVANADLKQTTMRLHVMAPSRTDAAHMAAFRKLSRLSGASFDRAYMKGQVNDHDATVALFKKELERGQESNIRGFASKYLPTIQDHTIMIHNVAANLRADPSAKKMKRMMKNM